MAVDIRGLWRERDLSPSGQGYHYNRNAETYCLIGEAFLFEPFVQPVFVIGKRNGKTPAAPAAMAPEKLPDTVNITRRKLLALCRYQSCIVLSHAVH